MFLPQSRPWKGRRIFRVIPRIVFPSAADRLVSFNGGSTPFQLGPKRVDSSVKDAVAFWIKKDGCAAQPAHEQSQELHTDKYLSCEMGLPWSYTLCNAAITFWPGLRISGNSVPATDLMWPFSPNIPSNNAQMALPRYHSRSVFSALLRISNSGSLTVM